MLKCGLSQIKEPAAKTPSQGIVDIDWKKKS
jgi:hypothetical protein